MSSFIAQFIKEPIMKILLYSFTLIFGIFSYSTTIARDTPLSFLAPTVDLGNDTIICGGSILLDAGNTGATYLWSTGEITQTINVSSSGLIWVDVTDLTGTTRDSIQVDVLTTPADPSGSGLNLCGAGTASLSVNSNSDYTFWFDSNSGGNLLVVGNNADIEVSTSTDFYVQAVNSTPRYVGPPNNSFSTGTLSNPNGVGLIFDVDQEIIIESVKIYPRPGFTMSFDIQLKDNANNILQSRSYTLTNAPDSIDLTTEFYVQPGTGYKIVCANPSSGTRMFRNLSATFPITYSGLVSITNCTVPGNYYPFYNWKVIPYGSSCVSNRVAIPVVVNPNPDVQLGNDTLLCGNSSMTLDVTQTGGSYLWSTGATSGSINISTSGSYDVSVSIGNCTVSDTITVSSANVPLDPAIMDTSICGGGIVELSTGNVNTFNLWFDALNNGSLLQEGETVEFEVNNTETFYVEGLSTNISSAGAIANTISSGGLSFPQGVGLIFDAQDNIILQAVKIYPRVGFNTEFDVELLDFNSNIVATKHFTLTNPPDSVELDLWFQIPAGNNYTLRCNNVASGGRMFRNFSANFPYVVPGLISVTNCTVNGNYYPFYDWKVFSYEVACKSNRIPVTVTVNPAPEADLGRDSILCGGASTTLDVTQTGASYLWSTGETTGSIAVSSTDTFSVSVQLGDCSVSDTVILTSLDLPQEPAISDTAVCSNGSISLSAPSQGNYTLWYDAISNGSLINNGVDVSYVLKDDSTFYVETINSLPVFAGPPDNTFSTGTFSGPEGVGLIFDVFEELIIESVVVYPRPSKDMSFDIELRDQNDSVLSVRHFDIAATLVPSLELETWFKLDPGVNYKMVCTNTISGTSLFRNTTATFPFTTTDLLEITDCTISGNYYPFYNWKVIPYAVSCNSNRKSVNVDVVLPLQLPEEIYSCEPFTLDAGISAQSYLWNTGATTSSIPIDQTGSYIITTTDGGNCTVSDTVDVEIPQNAGLPDDGILCGNILTTNYDTTAIFQWSTGATSSTLQISQTGTYFVEVNEPRGCLLTDTITVTGFDDFPIVNLGPDLSVCDSVVLNAGNPGLSFEWNTGETSQAITASSSGLYFVGVTNINNCTSFDTVGISVTPSPQAQFVVGDTVYGGPDRRVSFVNQSTFGSYLWDFGDGNNSSSISPTHTFADTGNYCVSLVVTDILNSCGQDTFTKCFTVFQYPTAIGELIPFAEISLYPNPTTHLINLDMSLQKTGEIFLSIINIHGQSIWRYEVQGEKGEYEINIQTANWSPGVYQLLILQNGSLMRKSFIKN